MKRERERKKKKKKRWKILRCRIAARSQASILSFGPVHRNLHGKLPRRGDERKASEWASTPAELSANRIKFRSPATTARKAAARCWCAVVQLRLPVTGKRVRKKYKILSSLFLSFSLSLSLLAVYYHGHFILLVDTNRRSNILTDRSRWSAC